MKNDVDCSSDLSKRWKEMVSKIKANLTVGPFSEGVKGG